MITIKGNCPTCGDIELTGADVTVHILETGQRIATYEHHGHQRRAPILGYIGLYLVLSGAIEIDWRVPVEWMETAR